jgi:large subunit ribosomal protein L4
MANISLSKKTGVSEETYELQDNVFNVVVHEQAIYDVVNAQRAAMRQGTASTKTRSEVRGGGKKPYRQKGTGRARQGSIRSIQWVGGGIAFGPTPRKYYQKINKKVRHLAFKSALSYHYQQNTLYVIDEFGIDSPKTKEFVQVLDNLGIKENVLIVSDDFTDNEILSASNIPYVRLQTVSHASVYEVLKAKKLVLTSGAVKVLEEVLSNE